MISKNKAYKIAKSIVGDNDVINVYEPEEFNLGLYFVKKPDKYWVCAVANKYKPSQISSSEVILISKKTGEVIYHGMAQDEG